MKQEDLIEDELICQSNGRSLTCLSLLNHGITQIIKKDLVTLDDRVHQAQNVVIEILKEKESENRTRTVFEKRIAFENWWKETSHSPENPGQHKYKEGLSFYIIIKLLTRKGKQTLNQVTFTEEW